MSSKIRIKYGPVEVEYEGSEAFLKEELPELLKAVSELHSRSEFTSTVKVNGKSSTSDGDNSIQGTTGTLAAKLSVKSGPELVLASAAHLFFVMCKPSFARQELINEMKSANTYYKQTYINNLSSSLKNLVKEGKLMENSKGVYSLSANTQKELRARLDQ
jgi:hypothetical protein